MIDQELNDSLDTLFGGASPKPAPAAPAATEARRLPADLQRAAEVGGFFEPCRKCGGRGTYGNFGRCFACNGKGGKSYKTSSAERAKNRQQAADRKVSKVEAFQTANPAIFAWLTANAPRFEFAASVLEKLNKYGDLTDGQMAAIERCIEKDKARSAERAANAPTVDVSRIVAAFDKAREKATRTGQMGIWTRPVKLQADGQDMVVQVAKPGSKWAGTLFVESTDGKRLGYVKDGRYNRPFACTDAEAAAVLKACSDPEQAAVAYGKAWSVCCICNQTLTNDESIARGIGPICASNYGW